MFHIKVIVGCLLLLSTGCETLDSLVGGGGGEDKSPEKGLVVEVFGSDGKTDKIYYAKRGSVDIGEWGEITFKDKRGKKRSFKHNYSYYEIK